MPDLAFNNDEFLISIQELVPQHQQSILIKGLGVTEQSEFDKIGLLLTGERRNVGFIHATGVSTDPRPGIWQNVVAEVYDFLCTSSRKYSQERSEGAKAIKSIITVVATALAAQLNVAIGVVVGAVTVALMSALKIGTNAWCRTHAPEKS